MAQPTLSGRQFVLLSSDPQPEGGGLPPVGSRPDVLKKLGNCNTAPEREGSDDVLFGPGIRVELTPGQDPITQMLVTVNEEEIGFLVLTRLVNEFQWKLLDPNTGRELTPTAE